MERVGLDESDDDRPAIRDGRQAMSYRGSRVQLLFAALMILGSIAALLDGHLTTVKTALYVFVLGLGLVIAAQTIARSKRRG
jgi:hydrogenase/urease accessory protein HupE